MIIRSHKAVPEIWSGKRECTKCNEICDTHLVNMKLIVSFLFLPIMSRNEKHYLVCDKCGGAKELTRNEYKNIREQSYNLLSNNQIPKEIIKADFHPSKIGLVSKYIKLVLSGLLSFIVALSFIGIAANADNPIAAFPISICMIALYSLPLVFSLKNFIPMNKKYKAYKNAINNG